MVSSAGSAVKNILTGKFPEAIETATKALSLAEPRQQSLAERIYERREFYKAGKPYRDQPQGEHPKTGRE